MRKHALTLLIALLALPLGINAQEATEIPANALPPEETAHIRVAHFAPGAPAVDVLLDGEPTGLTALAYPDVTDWIAIPAGPRQVSLVAADDSGTEALIAPVALDLAPMTWTTLAAVSSADTLELAQFVEVTDPLLPGTARVTYFNAIEGAGGIGFFRDDHLYTTLAYKDSFPIEHDSQTYDYHISTSGDAPEVLAELPELDLRESYNYLIAAVGDGSADATPELVVAETNPIEFALGRGEVAEPGTLVQVIEANDLTGALDEALQQADLLEELAGEGPYTLFAPAELKLENLPTDDPDALAEFLRGHLVEGLYLSQDLAEGAALQSVNGQSINATVEGDAIYVNGARVLDVNIPARNGVIHLISGFVVPEANG